MSLEKFLHSLTWGILYNTYMKVCWPSEIRQWLKCSYSLFIKFKTTRAIMNLLVRGSKCFFAPCTQKRLVNEAKITAKVTDGDLQKDGKILAHPCYGTLKMLQALFRYMALWIPWSSRFFTNQNLTASAKKWQLGPSEHWSKASKSRCKWFSDHQAPSSFWHGPHCPLT